MPTAPLASVFLAGGVMAARGARLVIEKLIPDGKALGRLDDGRVVIVSGAVPGDRIELDAVTESKGLVKGHAFRVIEPSALRVAPSCEVHERCGGCDWMVLPLDEQRRQKLEILKEALLRTGKLDWRGRELELVTSDQGEGYRGRVRLQVAHGRIGFFQRGSHDLVEPAPCRVSSAAVNAALGELRELLRQHPGGLDGFAWLEVREGTDGTVGVLLEPAEKGRNAAARPAARRLIEALGVRFVVAVGAEVLPTERLQRFDLTDDTFMLSAPQGFVQVNWEVNRRLIGRVLAGVAARGIRSFVDAYCGSGNFALPLLRRGLEGLAVESNASAIASAREAARRQGLGAEGFVVADAAAYAERLARQGKRFDLVLVDPPRAGLVAGLEPLARLSERWFLMCSCNPVTLARDLARLGELGFQLDELVAFDMFPQTHHLETLAWLRAPEP